MLKTPGTGAISNEIINVTHVLYVCSPGRSASNIGGMPPMLPIGADNHRVVAEGSRLTETFVDEQTRVYLLGAWYREQEVI